MSNPFYYLFGLLLAIAYPTGLEPLAFARTRVCPEAATCTLAFYAILAWVVHRRLLARGMEHRAGLARFLLRIAAILLFGVLLFVFHWPLWVWELGLEENVLLSTLLTMAPLFALFGTLAFVATRFEPLFRGGGAAPGASLAFAFRSFLALSFLPLVVMLLLDLALQRIGVLRKAAFVYPSIGWGVILVSMLLILVVLPSVLRVVFGARALPPGPLRERLQGLCRAVGFRYGDLLSVRTGGLRLANAFIVGLARPWRFVFFTDAILAGLGPEELECVLAHEIVHSKKRHMVFFVFFTVGFALLSALGQELLDSTRAPAWFGLPLLLAWGATFWFGFFGYVSRRFESEADLVAARIAPQDPGAPSPYGAARRMAAALEVVADLNRVPRDAWSWRHFSIGRRAELLLAAGAAPSVGLIFERRCATLRRMGVALLVLGLGCGTILGILQLSKVEENRRKLQAYERAEHGRQLKKDGSFEEAARELWAGIEGGAEEAEYLLDAAECERRLGRAEAARRAEERARRLRPVDPRVRLALAR